MGVPGSDIDDGFAIALAVDLADQSLELITTVNGNTDVETSTLLALDLLHRLGRPDIPVVKGARSPLLRPVHDHPARERVLGVRERLAGRTPASGRAATAIIDLILANPGEITLVTIGPLTNVALAVALEPAVTTTVKEIIVMGGAFLRTTNMLAMPGEFNIWVDTEAAAIVLASGAPLRFIGLDVTLQVQLDRADADRLKATGRPFATYAGECAHAWIDHLRDAYPGQDLVSAPMGRLDEAAAALRTAADINLRINARPWLAHTWLDLADVLRRRGAAGDHAEAAALAARAAAEARRLDLPGPLARGDGLLSRLQTERRASDPLSARERETAALVATGLNNREIAARFVLSERTVESHVSNALRRLGLTSRTQLATWALRSGLDPDQESPDHGTG
jgi:inosine-uridine nucleoside N-ribohydrolase/DNA-binding CsgD family transcriptional regulator